MELGEQGSTPRVVARDLDYYDEDNISSPVTNLTSIRIAFILLVMAELIGWIKDVNGAFLTGEFQATDPVL